MSYRKAVTLFFLLALSRSAEAQLTLERHTASPAVGNEF